MIWRGWHQQGQHRELEARLRLRRAVRVDHLALLGTLATAGAVAALASHRTPVFISLAPYAVFFGANAVSFLYTTRRGKFHVWRTILDGLNLRGTERVLDLGCGRGGVLVAVAHRLTTGRVIGVDVWRAHDQSGNAREVTLRNAALEGVQDRIDVETADMRASTPIPCAHSVRRQWPDAGSAGVSGGGIPSRQRRCSPPRSRPHRGVRWGFAMVVVGPVVAAIALFFA